MLLYRQGSHLSAQEVAGFPPVLADGPGQSSLNRRPVLVKVIACSVSTTTSECFWQSCKDCVQRTPYICKGREHLRQNEESFQASYYIEVCHNYIPLQYSLPGSQGLLRAALRRCTSKS